MGDCCSSNSCSSTKPRKAVCPSNGKTYSSVSEATILHHVKEPWIYDLKPQGYYFCDDPDCDVVYFGEDETTILKQSLRTVIGVKETSPEALICFCYGVSRINAETNSAIKEFVIKQTKTGSCACDTRNPSGKCCLKDFPEN